MLYFTEKWELCMNMGTNIGLTPPNASGSSDPEHLVPYLNIGLTLIGLLNLDKSVE